MQEDKMHYKKFLIFIIFIFGFLLLNGCCLIGLGIGAISDAHTPDSVFVKQKQWPVVKRGQRIKVKLKNGQQVIGKYLNFKRSLTRSYLTRYYSFMQSTHRQNQMPKPYEKIQVQTVDNKALEGMFLGVDQRNLNLLTTDLQSFRVLLINIKKITNNRRKTYQIKSINDIISMPNFPLYSEKEINKEPKLTILVNNEPKSFVPTQISKIEILPRKNGKLIGFLVGAAIDAVFVIFTINSMSHISMGGSLNLGPM